MGDDSPDNAARKDGSLTGDSIVGAEREGADEVVVNGGERLQAVGEEDAGRGLDGGAAIKSSVGCVP